MKISLSLPFPPSANVYYRRARNVTYLSEQGKRFKQQVSEIVAEHGQKLSGRLSVYITLAAPTKRKYDIDNRIKATLDALQDAGVFDDDEQVDFIQVNRLKPYRGGGCKVHVFGDKP